MIKMNKNTSFLFLYLLFRSLTESILDSKTSRILKRSVFSRRRVGCRNASTEQVWNQRKIKCGGGVYVRMPLIFGDWAVYTRFFSLWIQITMVLQLFLLKKLKEAFLWIKWPSPRLTSQGWWVHKGIALDTPLGHNRNQGKDASGQRRWDLALLEHQCAVAFPRLPPVPTSCPTLHNYRGSDVNPCHLESQSVLLGRAKGKFGIRIPKCEIKKTWIKKLSTFSKNWSLVNS